MTKVTHSETHDNTLVCKGKLVLIKGDIFINSKFQSPIIISETEIPNINDVCLLDIHIVTNHGNSSREKDYKKVLALTENFSPEILKDIVDGRLKDGNEVFVKCETVIDSSRYNTKKHEEPFIQQIKLDKDNHITILPDNKEEGWNDIMAILSNPDVSWGTKEAMVREKYNSPTKK